MGRRKTGYIVGVDLGGTKILAAVFDSRLRIVGRSKAKTLAESDAATVLERIALCVKDALEDAGVKRKKVLALGIGSPGPLDPDRGVITFSPNLGWRNVKLKKGLESMLGFPVVVDNDVNMGTWGEYMAGAGRGADDMIGVFVGTGIGGGIIINRRLLHGYNRNAGEIGHMVIDLDGPPCNCGVRGCLEALASKTALTRDIREAVAAGERTALSEFADLDSPATIRSGALARAYNSGDALAARVLNDSARVLGVAVGSLVNLLSPEVVVIGGGVYEALGERLLPLVDAAARQSAFDHCMENVKIRLAELGDDSGVVGAAHIARERHGK